MAHPRDQLEATQLHPKRAIELLALAVRGLLRTPDMPITKDWSKRVLKNLPPAKADT
jgi:hypothetical protein